MLSPARRHDAARYLQRRHKVSERRVCGVVGQHRSTQRYSAIAPEYELRLVACTTKIAFRWTTVATTRPFSLLLRRAKGESRVLGWKSVLITSTVHAG